MKFFDNIYNFIAKKQGKLFAIIGFAAYVAALVFTFLGSFDSVAGGDGALGYLIAFAFNGLIIAGIIFGYFFKNNKLLFVSFVVFLVLTVYNGIVAQTASVANVFGDNGADVAQWIFGFLFDIVVAGFIVLVFLIHLFNFKGLKGISRIVYLVIFPVGFLAWIMSIVHVAQNNDRPDVSWSLAIVPLFECAALLFLPVILNKGDELEEKGKEPVPAPAPKAEEPTPVEEPKEEKPAPKKAPAKKAAPKKEVVEPEVEDEPKE